MIKQGKFYKVINDEIIIAESFVDSPSVDELDTWDPFISGTNEELIRIYNSKRTKSSIVVDLSPYNGIARKAKVTSNLIIDTVNKIISVALYIEHEGHAELDGVHTAYAKSSDYIPQLSTSSYDYLYGLAQGGVPFEDVIRTGVQFADMDGSINLGLYK